MKKGKQHTQHTSRFISKLNSVNKLIPTSPFRYYDEVWIIGKYKGLKLVDTPKQYLQWALKNMSLSPTAYSILEKVVLNHHTNKIL